MDIGSHLPGTGEKRESGQEKCRSETLTERSWNDQLVILRKTEHQQIYLPPGHGQDERSQDELKTTNACQKDKGRRRTGSQTLGVEI